MNISVDTLRRIDKMLFALDYYFASPNIYQQQAIEKQYGTHMAFRDYLTETSRRVKKALKEAREKPPRLISRCVKCIDRDGDKSCPFYGEPDGCNNRSLQWKAMKFVARRDEKRKRLAELNRNFTIIRKKKRSN